MAPFQMPNLKRHLQHSYTAHKSIVYKVYTQYLSLYTFQSSYSSIQGGIQYDIGLKNPKNIKKKNLNSNKHWLTWGNHATFFLFLSHCVSRNETKYDVHVGYLLSKRTIGKSWNESKTSKTSFLNGCSTDD